MGYAFFFAHAVDDIHLIFHQRYQRRHNNGYAVHDE